MSSIISITAAMESTSTDHSKASTNSALILNSQSSNTLDATSSTTPADTYCAAVPVTSGMSLPRARCTNVPVDIPAIEITIAHNAGAVTSPIPSRTLSITTTTTPVIPSATPTHWLRRKRSFKMNRPATEVTTGCSPAINALSPDGSPRLIAINTPPKYTACIHVPTIAEVDHIRLSSFGARTSFAITYSKTAAVNIRTVKNDSGPALFVLYRATTKPVLHSATNIHGASRSNNVPLLLMQDYEWMVFSTTNIRRRPETFANESATTDLPISLA